MQRARRLGLYAALGEEMPTRGLAERLKRRGVEVLLPRVRGGELEFAPAPSFDELVPGRLGVPEPPGEVPAADRPPELVVVPGLAFDAAGNRLGYGKGFYDRWLARHRVPAVGLAFAVQEVDEVPHGPADRPVDAWVTETGVRRCRRGRAVLEDRQLEQEVERQLGIIAEGAEVFVGEEELRERLRGALAEGRGLRVKLGMDPSAPDLHLGHSVVLMKLRRFQELGHTPIFLVGDFTARIGDPSGRKKTRPALSAEEVKRNAETYVRQVSRLLDVGSAELRFNSEWMEPMRAAELVRLCATTTVARLLERDDFARRYAAGDPIAVHELLYPLIQGYDSVALRADVELGGTDQTFNLLMGREIQRAYGQPPQAVLTHPLLVGTDGHEKMSKSLGNLIALTEAPAEMYGKVMSISDELMHDWIRILSAGEWPELEEASRALREGREGSPLELKERLARAVVARFHGEPAAAAAEAHFRRVVRGRELPEDIPEVELAAEGAEGRGLLYLLRELGFAGSTSEARRLVAQGAVAVDGEAVRDPKAWVPPGEHLVRAGRRRFARVRILPPAGSADPGGRPEPGSRG